MKKKKKQGKKQNKGAWLKIIEYIQKNIAVIIGVIFTAVVSAVITKACNRMVPDPPAIVEKIPDTINVVHVYEPFNDSTFNHSQKKLEEIVNDAVKKRRPKNKDQSSFKDNDTNIIANDITFPNAKGYSPRSAAPYFSLEMTDNNQPYIDFICHFFNDCIIDEIYCLSIKVFEIQNDGGRVYVIDENYKKQKGDNIIRLNNIFSSKNYEIEVGFIFNRDRNSIYPNFYRETRYINNKK